MSDWGLDYTDSEDSFDSADSSTQHTNKTNPIFLKDRAEWLSSIESYIKQCGKFDLDLNDQNLHTEDVRCVLEFLKNAEVNELNLARNYLDCNISLLSEGLICSKIKKLNLELCSVDNNILEILGGMELTHLNISNNFFFDLGETFCQNVMKPQLKSLNLLGAENFTDEGALFFVDQLSEASIYSLQIDASFDHSYLFSKLSSISVMDLNLSYSCLTHHELKMLSINLKHSRLEKLNLCGNDIFDAGLDILGDGLLGSKVIDLNVEDNKIFGYNNFARYLKGTKIKILKIGRNPISYSKMFLFPNLFINTCIVALDVHSCDLGDHIGQALMECLKHTSISTLNVSDNHLGQQSISEFAQNVKESNVVDVDFSFNEFSTEIFIILGGCLHESKIRHINLNGCCKFNEAVGLFYILEISKESPIITFKIENNCISMNDIEILGKVLRNSSFTHFEAGYNDFSRCAATLLANFQFTAITNLNLSACNLGDKDAEVLTKCLEGSNIVHLNLSFNQIQSTGAKALAPSLRKSKLLCVYLNCNEIHNDGLEALAEAVDGTLITTLDVRHNPGDRLLMIESILWKNRTSAFKLVTTFKQLAPEGNFFQMHTGNIAQHLEDCLYFYKTIVNQPSSISLLLSEESLSFSRSQILSIFRDFPLQIAIFIAIHIEASVLEHVTFLKKAEKLELGAVVELLLLNRPLYMIDDKELVLHPYVYKLLHKYELPICNFGVEPNGIKRLQKYFLEHADFEGATDILNLLEKL